MHPSQDQQLRKLMQLAYSAEKAAAFAYQGHAASLKNPQDKRAVRQIELDEWHHRNCLKQMLQEYDIPISQYYEWRFHIIGKIISASCFFIGWFMPHYFAGRLESGNVCEYFRMMKYFNDIGITKHDQVLFEMGIKEKEHEIFFLNMIKDSPWLRFFEFLFSWGKTKSYNDLDLSVHKRPQESKPVCHRTKA